MADELRADRVAQAWRAARSAAPGAEGEAARAGLRAVAEPFLRRAAAEPLAEIDERTRRRGDGEVDPDIELIRAVDPDERARLHASRADLEHALGEARSEVRRQSDAAARAAGAEHAWSFLAAGLAVDAAAWLAPFERAVIEPLDAEVRDAVLQRWRSSRLVRGDTMGPGDVAALAAAADHEADLAPSAIERAMGEVGRAVRAIGPLPERVDAARAWPRLRPTARRTRLDCGAIAGPLGLARALAESGAGLRLDFCRERVAERAHFADPAFAAAARTLFRRLVLQAELNSWLGLPADPPLRQALRLEESLAPRQAWAYLFIGSRAAGSAEPDRRTMQESLERATQRPVPAGDLARGWLVGPDAADLLRGTCLGLLYEERLLTRHGRRWIGERRALEWLAEIWEAEPGETAETMAAASGVGTIEPTPILDGCRP